MAFQEDVDFASRRGPGWAALLFCAALPACAPDQTDLEGVERALQPRMAHFERFERWAHRTLSADGVTSGPGALTETLFAPMRRDQSIRGVWVERIRPLEQIYELPSRCSEPPSANDFQHLRSLDVRWVNGRCRDESVTYLRRSRDREGDEIQLTIAYPRNSTAE